MAYTYNNDELALFMQAKRDETGSRKYFVPQVDEKNGVNATTDIGREMEFMTCENPTKFLSMTEESHLGDHQDKLWSILVCYSPTFDPSETGNIVFVFDKKYNFIRFATLLAVLYGCQWPLFQPGKSQGERNKFFKSMPSYNERYNPAYIGYLLGYQMKDILAWGYNNGDYKKTEANEIAESCETFITEAIDSKFIKDLAELAEQKTIRTRLALRELSRGL